MFFKFCPACMADKRPLISSKENCRSALSAIRCNSVPLRASICLCEAIPANPMAIIDPKIEKNKIPDPK